MEEERKSHEDSDSSSEERETRSENEGGNSQDVEMTESGTAVHWDERKTLTDAQIAAFHEETLARIHLFQNIEEALTNRSPLTRLVREQRYWRYVSRCQSAAGSNSQGFDINLQASSQQEERTSEQMSLFQNIQEHSAPMNRNPSAGSNIDQRFWLYYPICPLEIGSNLQGFDLNFEVPDVTYIESPQQEEDVPSDGQNEDLELRITYPFLENGLAKNPRGSDFAEPECIFVNDICEETDDSGTKQEKHVLRVTYASIEIRPSTDGNSTVTSLNLQDSERSCSCTFNDKTKSVIPGEKAKHLRKSRSWLKGGVSLDTPSDQSPRFRSAQQPYSRVQRSRASIRRNTQNDSTGGKDESTGGKEKDEMEVGITHPSIENGIPTNPQGFESDFDGNNDKKETDDSTGGKEMDEMEVGITHPSIENGIPTNPQGFESDFDGNNDKKETDDSTGGKEMDEMEVGITHPSIENGIPTNPQGFESDFDGNNDKKETDDSTGGKEMDEMEVGITHPSIENGIPTNPQGFESDFDGNNDKKETDDSTGGKEMDEMEVGITHPSIENGIPTNPQGFESDFDGNNDKKETDDSTGGKEMDEMEVGITHPSIENGIPTNPQGFESDFDGNNGKKETDDSTGGKEMDEMEVGITHPSIENGIPTNPQGFESDFDDGRPCCSYTCNDKKKYRGAGEKRKHLWMSRGLVKRGVSRDTPSGRKPRYRSARQPSSRVRRSRASIRRAIRTLRRKSSCLARKLKKSD
ncbi:uncharacterized protein LOC129958405 isoform X2 [Argiope bruennichi]|uniref:uncharacterized protein LOC129958405 isoform X2 n=1 Tax=Argiope bruennichi TaxID=94029 RepID=UPI002494BD9B|nr:uncharacterized protein LOC129958405 isoform X2 [Argiope bruennichi]